MQMNEEDKESFIPTGHNDHWKRFKHTQAEAEPLRKFVNSPTFDGKAGEASDTSSANMSSPENVRALMGE